VIDPAFAKARKIFSLIHGLPISIGHSFDYNEPEIVSCAAVLCAWIAQTHYQRDIIVLQDVSLSDN